MAQRKVTDPYLVAFGAHLRSLRKREGLSQEDLAEKAGIHVTYLSGVERGLRNPSVINIRKLAQSLGVPTRELFYFEENPSIK
jgi:transcriptional regulator with XRE-family HTH domain